jgi:hypothetical protein
MPTPPKRSRSADTEDSSFIPDGHSFAIVIPPRMTNTMGTLIMKFLTMTADVDGILAARSVDRTDNGSKDTSRQQSIAKTSGLTNEVIKELMRTDPNYVALFKARSDVQRVMKKLEEDKTLSYTHVDALKNVLGTLALLTFSDLVKAPQIIQDTKILKVLEALTNATTFSDDVAEPAKCLRDRWAAGDYTAQAIKFEDEIDSGHDNEENEAVVQELMQQLMRGIRVTTSSMKLQEGYSGKRSANVFGHNGLSVGDWWPYQLCALRDGAHGSRQGGIAGKIAEGAYSIVISADSEYNDSDEGYTLTYSGTRGDAAAQRTDSTQKLVTSKNTQRPVRLIRKGCANIKKKWYPACGFRYDGLYLVQHAVFTGSVYNFTLERVQAQKPLEGLKRIPDRTHKLAWAELTNYF